MSVEEDADGFDTVTSYVENNLGFATSHYNDSYLQRRIKSRMRRTRSEDYREYLRLLRNDDEEGYALLDALSINVTGFFRNPEVWDGIRTVLRELTDEHRAVRIWSAACADGREPYSLAMLALDDPNVDADKLSIRGTDINERALARASEAVYESNHTSDLHEQLQYLDHYQAYVERDGDQFVVDDDVKEMVTFEKHDLIRDATAARFELVTCRNLFIYIDVEYKGPVIDTISESLHGGGYLVIGKAETIPKDAATNFEVVDGRKRIYQRSQR
ncbi:chemotaxis protein CheR [Halobacteriales archaeon QS_1_68_20]|nr:MAG: chemotaxis protein CheR [Halobacteriales archaeon QS_1_68_20]